MIYETHKERQCVCLSHNENSKGLENRQAYCSRRVQRLPSLVKQIVLHWS